MSELKTITVGGTTYEIGGGGILPHLVISTDSGLTVTVTKGTTTITATETSEGIYECDIPDIDLDPWTLSDTENTKQVIIDTATIYQLSMTLPVPEGATATPTDDIDTWIKCAGLENTNNYSTLAEVMADTELFDTLLRDSNACDYIARSTTWAIASGLVPEMTGTTTPSGEVIYSSQYTGQEAWRAFDNSDDTIASTGTPEVGYFGYHFTSPTICKKVSIMCYGFNANASFTFKIQGSNNGSDWTDLSSTLTFTNGNVDKTTNTFTFSNDTAYSYYKVQYVSASASSGYSQCRMIQFYSADITSDRDAMTRIGKYDYCADKLSSNSIWAQAIGNSAYMESVWDKSVPKMTDNTTPSGECIYSGQNTSTAYYAWKAFNPSEQKGWLNDSTNPYIHVNNYVGYEFTSPTKVYICEMVYLFDNTPITIEGKIQAYDGTDWIDVTDNITVTSNSTNTPTIAFISGNTGSCTRYRFLCTTAPNGHTTYGLKLQFYGRADSTVYSPLVPVMTSNTTPSGVCVSSSVHESYQPYLAFDGDNSTFWGKVSSDTTPYVGYHFTKPVVVTKFFMRNGGYGNDSASVKVKGSDDGITWTDITSDITISTGTYAENTVTFENSTAFEYYALFALDRGSGNYWNVATLQFYQAIPSTTKVHSCPNDTLYITDGVDTEVLCTTDSNGIGSIDWSDFDAGTYAIYSSVAKDPSNLSNDYKKIVRVTNTAYGHTTDAYIMPDPVKVTYWYGYDKNCELISTGNGWSSGYTLRTDYVTFNTNNIDITEDGYHYWGGIGSKAPSLGRYVKAIMKTTTSGSTYTPHPRGGTSKSEATWSEGYTTETYANDTLVTADMTTEGLYYVLIVDTRNYNKIRVSAMWIE